MERDTERIKIIRSKPGYAHTKFFGTCSPDVTVEEIEKKIYHVCFGGRDAYIINGQWSAIRHDD